MNEWDWWKRSQWCSHCNRDITYFGHAPDCPECIAAVPDVEQQIAEAVAAEREALVFCLETRAAEYHELTMSSGYLSDTVRAAYMEEAYREVIDTVRARAGEGE